MQRKHAQKRGRNTAWGIQPSQERRHRDRGAQSSHAIVAKDITRLLEHATGAKWTSTEAGRSLRSKAARVESLR